MTSRTTARRDTHQRGGSLLGVLRGVDPTTPTAVRFLIIGLTAGVLVDTAQTLSPPQPDLDWFRLWLGIFALTQVVYYALARHAFEGWVGIGVPVVNIVCFGFAGSQGSSALWYAALFPATWLGLNFGYRGLVAVFAVTVPLGLLGIVAGTADKSGQEAIAAWLVCSLAALPSSIAYASFTQTGRSLIRARRLREAIVEAVDVGILHVDARGRTVSVNAQQEVFARLAFPGDATEPAAALLFDADGTTRLPRERWPVHRVLQEGDFERELVWVGEDPLTRRALEVTARRMVDEGGRVEGATVAFHDVTSLMRALKVKAEFVSSVSHELRTPLTSIVGFIELTQDEGLPPDADMYLERAHHNAMRLRSLVEDLLATADDGADVRHHRLVDLAALAATAVDSLSVQAREAAVALTLRADPAVVHGEARRLEQVIVNLVSNAVKYTHRQGRVEVECGVEGEDCFVRVCDTGIGMSEQEQSRLFERFFRAEAVRHGAIPGVGLGLAISRDIVRAHGGSLTATSVPGEGSTFEMRLPAVTGAV